MILKLTEFRNKSVLAFPSIKCSTIFEAYISHSFFLWAVTRYVLLKVYNLSYRTIMLLYKILPSFIIIILVVSFFDNTNKIIYGILHPGNRYWWSQIEKPLSWGQQLQTVLLLPLYSINIVNMVLFWTISITLWKIQ